MIGNTNFNDESAHGWQESIVTLFEQVSNFIFYVLAVFIIMIPLLKRVADIFPSTDNIWWVIASAVIFVIIVPSLATFAANISFISLEKIRKGEFLPVIFKPLKSIFAVVSIYGVVALEYKVIHGKTDKTLFEVFFELLKSA